MKKSVLSLCAVTLFSLQAFALSWATSFDIAKVQAQKEGKIVMLMLSQEGCPMCDFMKSVTLKDPDVATLLESRFIPVEVDINKGKTPAGFRAFGTPTFYFVDSTGKKVGKHIVGGAKADVFSSMLSSIKK
jgi:thioredoxin-related protein